MKPPYHCGYCPARWGGYGTCHCTYCHETFTDLTAFDKHRKRYKCLKPEEAGLQRTNRNYSCWGLEDE